MDNVQKSLLGMHREIHSWRKLAAMPTFTDTTTGRKINFSTLRAYAHGRDVVDLVHRRILGLPLPETETVELCEVCLVVHTKRCPHATHRQARQRAPMWRDLWAWYPGSFIPGSNDHIK